MATHADVAAATAVEAAAPQKTFIVDCDVHLAPPNAGEILKFLPQRWQEYNAAYERRFGTAFYPRRSENGERFDAWPPSGLKPGTDFDFVRSHHFDSWGIDVAVITPTMH